MLCADGSEVPTGTITIDAMHAPGSFSLQAAMAHYDNTATGVAAVTIKNGKLGPWYCGAMFPGGRRSSSTGCGRTRLRATGDR